MAPSIADLQKQSDVIAEATLAGTDDSQGVEIAQLNLTRIIQGQPGSLSMRALVPSSSGTGMLGGDTPPKTGLIPRSLVGRSGIWFLRAADSGWRVIPLDDRRGEEIDTSIPVDRGVEPPAGDVEQQLLIYLVRWYRSLPAPGRVDEDFRLFVSLERADPQKAAIAIAPLLTSTRADQYGAGLAAAIRLGSVEALSRVAPGIGTLRSNPKLREITDAIGLYFQPPGPDVVRLLGEIAALQSDVPRMDAAVGSALQRVGTKDVLPVMAILLDSHDPEAQLRAAWFFAWFAKSPDQMPSQNSTRTPAEYARFWKTWWASNKGGLGF